MMNLEAVDMEKMSQIFTCIFHIICSPLLWLQWSVVADQMPKLRQRAINMMPKLRQRAINMIRGAAEELFSRICITIILLYVGVVVLLVILFPRYEEAILKAVLVQTVLFFIAVLACKNFFSREDES